MIAISVSADKPVTAMCEMDKTVADSHRVSTVTIPNGESVTFYTKRLSRLTVDGVVLDFLNTEKAQ
jgi:hypothetical protein